MSNGESTNQPSVRRRGESHLQYKARVKREFEAEPEVSPGTLLHKFTHEPIIKGFSEDTIPIATSPPMDAMEDSIGILPNIVDFGEPPIDVHAVGGSGVFGQKTLPISREDFAKIPVEEFDIPTPDSDFDDIFDGLFSTDLDSSSNCEPMDGFDPTDGDFNPLAPSKHDNISPTPRDIDLFGSGDTFPLDPDIFPDTTKIRAFDFPIPDHGDYLMERMEDEEKDDHQDKDDVKYRMQLTKTITLLAIYLTLFLYGGSVWAEELKQVEHDFNLKRHAVSDLLLHRSPVKVLDESFFLSHDRRSLLLQRLSDGGVVQTIRVGGEGEIVRVRVVGNYISVTNRVRSDAAQENMEASAVRGHHFRYISRRIVGFAAKPFSGCVIARIHNKWLVRVRKEYFLRDRLTEGEAIPFDLDLQYDSIDDRFIAEEGELWGIDKQNFLHCQSSRMIQPVQLILPITSLKTTIRHIPNNIPGEMFFFLSTSPESESAKGDEFWSICRVTVSKAIKVVHFTRGSGRVLGVGNGRHNCIPYFPTAISRFGDMYWIADSSGVHRFKITSDNQITSFHSYAGFSFFDATISINNDGFYFWSGQGVFTKFDFKLERQIYICDMVRSSLGIAGAVSYSADLKRLAIARGDHFYDIGIHDIKRRNIGSQRMILDVAYDIMDSSNYAVLTDDLEVITKDGKSIDINLHDMYLAPFLPTPVSLIMCGNRFILLYYHLDKHEEWLYYVMEVFDENGATISKKLYSQRKMHRVFLAQGLGLFLADECELHELDGVYYKFKVCLFDPIHNSYSNPIYIEDVKLSEYASYFSLNSRTGAIPVIDHILSYKGNWVLSGSHPVTVLTYLRDKDKISCSQIDTQYAQSDHSLMLGKESVLYSVRILRSEEIKEGYLPMLEFTDVEVNEVFRLKIPWSIKKHSLYLLNSWALLYNPKKREYYSIEY